MPYPWIDDYLLQKPGVTKDLQPDWNWIRYQIGGKLFAAVCLDDQDQPYYITLKLDPAEGDFLRGQYDDSLPGSSKKTPPWNAVRAQGSVPDDLPRNLRADAYRLVLHALPKKKQREITGE